MDERIIGHIDMDAFFASVEERDKPYLKDFPVVIGADPQGGAGRGVVSTANYKARELGIHSATPITKAWELCEGARKRGGKVCVFITPSMGKYEQVSKEIFSIVREFVPKVSQSSVDEASMDMSFCKTFDEARMVAQHIKEAVLKKQNLTCSIGIGENKMIAKIASDYEKPNGLTVVTPENTDTFLSTLPIKKIPGVGGVTQNKLARLGVRTVQDARAFSWGYLQKVFGKNGFSLWEKVRGIDYRTVETKKPKNKSIGKHYTFNKDTYDMEVVSKVIKEQILSIIKQVHKKGFSEFKTIVLTVRFDNFVTKTRSITAEAYMSTQKDIEMKALKLLLPFFEKSENPEKRTIRLIGIRVENLR